MTERAALLDAFMVARRKVMDAKRVAEAARVEANKRKLYALDAEHDYDEAQRKLIEHDNALVLARQPPPGPISEGSILPPKV